MKCKDELIPQFYFSEYEPIDTFTTWFDINMEKRTNGIKNIAITLKDVKGRYEDTETGKVHQFRFKKNEWNVSYELLTDAIFFQEIEIDFLNKQIELK